MRLYNTKSRTVETFEPVREGAVRIYVCGLTPSAEAHLGHARSFLFFDILRRYLVHLGYHVTYVQNVTDIDDRSIAAAAASGESWRAIVEAHHQSFKRSMQRLHLREPDLEPRATDFIPQIIEMTAQLIARGHAYVATDAVYFRVKSFPRYGELSGRNVDELMIGARIAPGEAKEDPLDFALWKFAKAGEPAWPSPWGDGRPGWHIECSAMTHTLLGEPFDLHGGGYDLIFPHHENEIAQSESLLAHPPMVKYWAHGGVLTFDGKKMSKSLGNYEPLYALLDRHDPQAIRLLFLQTGYRKPMNFSEDSIAGAAEGLRRLFEAYDALRTAPPAPDTTAHDEHAAIAAFEDGFYAALDDDMNTSGALAELFKLSREVPAIVRAGAASAAAAFMHQALELLGISPLERSQAEPMDPLAKLGGDFLERLSARTGDVVHFNGGGSQAGIEAVIAARNAARAAKDFALADRLRVALAELGVTLEDSKGGTTWSVAG
ncbi:MAG TPA: cysteine--tRNA ligase [Candidatus Acidoferrales bacterium]|nr:cysteine--tRNA ligase [Candidatus Acidoferrales bacterium]